MKRILIAECKQEVSTFNPHLSQYSDFKIRKGQELLAYHRTVRNEIGGALSVLEDRPDIELIRLTVHASSPREGHYRHSHGIALRRSSSMKSKRLRQLTEFISACMVRWRRG